MNQTLLKRVAGLNLRNPQGFYTGKPFSRGSYCNSFVSKLGFCNTKPSSGAFQLWHNKQHRFLSVAVKHESVTAVGPDGAKYDIPWKPLGGFAQPRHAPKLAPRFAQGRISKLKTATSKTQNIRHSPWRLNLICQFAAGKTVPEALLQLKFCEKVKGPLVTSMIQSAANTAKQKYGLEPSQLEVTECFATHGTHLKRIKIMGRGRAGKKLRRFSHMRVVLREIDFPMKIMTCTTLKQRADWVKKMEVAMDDQEASREERAEIERLEEEVEKARRKKDEENAFKL
mmetsp:Transcript_6298/g.7981  ORF Transcript_6298/g.7981 Transcript_6298/m.7981 type:complete len:284 (+) Transcript_6298:67-918(+)